MKNREYELYEYHTSQNSEKESESNNTISELQSTGLNDAREATSEVDRSNEDGII